MKTQWSTRSVKNLVVSVIVAATLNIAVTAQPRPQNASDTDSEVRLEIFSDQSEMSLQYVAPDELTIESQKEQALENLEILADRVEAQLAYKVPVEYEDQSVQNLELLANTLMDELKYRAPGTIPELSNSANQKSMMSELKHRSRPVKVEVCRSSQDAWLINAGYYKSTREPAWNKVKKVFSSKQDEKQYVSGF